MVQIPTFKAKGTPTRTAGLATNIPNITTAATAPFEAISGLGNQMQSLAQKDYQNKLDFQNKKLQQKTDFEIQSYKQEKNNEQKLYEVDQKYKDKVYQIQQNQENEFKIAAFRIKQKQEINTVLGEVKNRANDLLFNLQTSNNFDDVNNSIQDLTKLKDSLKNNLTDESTKQLLDLEFNKSIVDTKINFNNTVRSNVIDSGIDTYNKEIDDLLYTATYSTNPSERLKAETTLISETGIVKEMWENKLLTNPEEQLRKNINALYSLRSEKLIKENPQRWLDYNEKNLWTDVLTTDQVVDYKDQAINAINLQSKQIKSYNKSQIAEIKSKLSDEKEIINITKRGNKNLLEGMLAQAESLIDPDTKELTDPELVQDLKNHISLIGAVESFKILDLKSQGDVLDTIQKQIRETDQILPIQATQLKIYEAINNDIKSGLQKDPLSTALKYGVIQDFPKIIDDNGNIITDNIQERVDVASQINSFYENELEQFKILTEEEENIFDNRVDNANSASEIVDLSQEIDLSFGVHSLDVFKQINEKNKIFAFIGAYTNMGNRDLAQSVANGFLRKKNNTAPSFSQSAAFESMFYNYFKDSLSYNEETEGVIKEVIENAIISKGAKQGWFTGERIEDFDIFKMDEVFSKNEKRIIQIMNESVGANYSQGNLISGGATEYNDKIIILPRNFPRQKTSYSGRSDLSEDDISTIIKETLKDHMLKAGNNQLPEARTISSPTDEGELRNLTIEEIIGSKQTAPLYFQTISPGKYTVSLFDPATTDLAYTYMQKDSPLPWVLDLNLIIPEINSTIQELGLD